MKLSKNILILFGSYLGAIALVACVAQLTVSLDTDSAPAGKNVLAESDLPADVPVSDTVDLPVAVLPDADTDAAATDIPDSGSDLPTDGSNADNDGISVYYLRTIMDGTASASIGIYDAEGALLDVLDTPVLALPASDRERLDTGIEVSGDEALAQLLEDFGG